jgi:hypothetical protein
VGGSLSGGGGVRLWRAFGGVWCVVCPAAGLGPEERREFRLGLVCR